MELEGGEDVRRREASRKPWLSKSGAARRSSPLGVGFGVGGAPGAVPSAQRLWSPLLRSCGRE
eukprot:5881451-Pyramimonas_sp.AAC.1